MGDVQCTYRITHPDLRRRGTSEVQGTLGKELDVQYFRSLETFACAVILLHRTCDFPLSVNTTYKPRPASLSARLTFRSKYHDLHT